MLLLGAQGGLTKFPKESLSLLLRLLVIMNTRNILSVTMIYPFRIANGERVVPTEASLSSFSLTKNLNKLLAKASFRIFYSLSQN